MKQASEVDVVVEQQGVQEEWEVLLMADEMQELVVVEEVLALQAEVVWKSLKGGVS